VDLRGAKDAMGRVLEATVVALADEIAAASGLVMAKAEGVPAAVIRGVHVDAPTQPAAALARPADEDLFRESPLQALVSRTEAEGFGPGEVSPEAVREALLAAGAAIGAGEAPPWILLEVSADGARSALIEAAARDARPILSKAPVMMVGFAGPLSMADDGSCGGRSDWDVALLSAGAAMQNTVLALHAQGLASRWILIGAVAVGPSLPLP
jgi:coenzyme F420-0:L-glutamate ligase/coenzyme F420-1:gamma-L-glutamate ligase